MFPSPLVVILEVHVTRRAVMEAECYPPVGLDRHRIAAAPAAGQRVKPKHRKGYIFQAVGCFQHRKNLLHLVHHIGPDAATVVLFVQPPQAVVLDRFDHSGTYCSV